MPTHTAPGPRPSRASDRLAVLLATGLGVGFFPFGPGTAGTLVPGLPLAWYLGAVGGAGAQAGAAVAVFLIGLWASKASEAALRRKDPPQVVIDEVAAFLILTAGLPVRWRELLLALVLFRLADILKPWPARALERRLPGAWGVMVDDVAAAAYARAGAEAAIRLLPGLFAAV
jgi:phosphatidylglycerophosphatase A